MKQKDKINILNIQIMQAFQLPTKIVTMTDEDATELMDNCDCFIDEDRIKSIGEILQYCIHNYEKGLPPTEFYLFSMGLLPYSILEHKKRKDNNYYEQRKHEDDNFFAKISLNQSKAIFKVLSLVLSTDKLSDNEYMNDLLHFWENKTALNY